jgi:REP element-mobilizing transposase RayT
MANSNRRVKTYGTVHHLVSRIAHRVYFLKDDERMDFLEIVRRVSEFTGVQLLGWCVMGNHFHLLAFLPEPQDIDECEILRRYGILKGVKSMEDVKALFEKWRKNGESGELRVSEWLAKQKSRMYDMGNFMKIAKQWFTEEYNRRNAHKGTLWESVYFDRIVVCDTKNMSECLAYIHLNPIRAAESDRFDGYVWSSYTAFRKGEPIATAGMHFVYGENASDGEIVEMHEYLMESLLEKEKLRRAEEIARKRAAGYEIAPDPLTTEAMIAQKAAHFAEVQKSLMELHEVRKGEGRRSASRESREKELLALLNVNPGMDVPLLAERLGVGVSMVYYLTAGMKKRGILERDRRKGIWNIVNQV